METDLSNKTLDELKVMVYDLLVEQQTINQELILVNTEISKREKEVTKN
jgi:hypothetical protein